MTLDASVGVHVVAVVALLTFFDIFVATLRFDVTVRVPISVPVGISVGISVGIGIAVGIAVRVPIDIGIDIPIDIGIDIPINIGIDIPINIGIDIPINIGVDIPINIGVDIPINIGVAICITIGAGALASPRDAGTAPEVRRTALGLALDVVACSVVAPRKAQDQDRERRQLGQESSRCDHLFLPSLRVVLPAAATGDGSGKARRGPDWVLVMHLP
jgi:hypothetical protein